MNHWTKNGISAVAAALVIAGTGWAVQHYHKPGQLDVISAQAMDMSQMRPPTGAAPVALALIRQGSLSDTVTYTGSIAPYNEQDITPRIVGTVISLPVYPGDTVRAGQLLAQLDTAEVGARGDQARQEARQARIGAQVAELTHRLHHSAALEQASAQASAAKQGAADAEAEQQGSEAAIGDADAAVQGARANADYWAAELVREKQLADAGAVSRQDYQSETAQALAARAALTQAQAKYTQARAMARASHAKALAAKQQVSAAQAGVRMAEVDSLVAEREAAQASAAASASADAARAANAQQGYGRLVSPLAGLVTARPVSPGTLVQPGTIIVKVAQIDRVRVQADVASADLAGVRVGTPVRVTVQGSGVSIAAHVTAVFPSANSQTRTAVVEAIVLNPGHRLLPGSFVTMAIAKTSASDKLQVPSSALVTQGGQSFVWTVGNGKPASAIYECVVCHIHYTSAQAKKFHYKDPMEGGKLVPIKSASALASPSNEMTAHQVPVQAGASDGTWTEITGAGLSDGQQIVTHGQAGLTEGARVMSVAWGADGPLSLPTSASANQGQILYRCEKCGMTYSAADAKRNHFIDPMDGGRLVPAQDK